MKFWMRAAPISVTAIGHTSFIAQAWDGGRRPPREAIFTLRESRFPAPPVFRSPARHRSSAPPRATGIPHPDRLHPDGPQPDRPTARPEPNAPQPDHPRPTTHAPHHPRLGRKRSIPAQFPPAHLPLFRVKSCGAEFVPLQEPRKPKAKVPFAATDLS